MYTAIYCNASQCSEVQNKSVTKLNIAKYNAMLENIDDL